MFVQAAENWHDSRLPGAGNLRGGGERGGGNAEKRYEDRAFAAEVHIGQVVHGNTSAQMPYQPAHAVPPADQMDLVEACAAFAYEPVDIGIALFRSEEHTSELQPL